MDFFDLTADKEHSEEKNRLIPKLCNLSEEILTLYILKSGSTFKRN